jgi:hypothetical protein
MAVRCVSLIHHAKTKPPGPRDPTTVPHHHHHTHKQRSNPNTPCTLCCKRTCVLLLRSASQHMHAACCKVPALEPKGWGGGLAVRRLKNGSEVSGVGLCGRQSAACGPPHTDQAPKAHNALPQPPPLCYRQYVFKGLGGWCVSMAVSCVFPTPQEQTHPPGPWSPASVPKQLPRWPGGWGCCHKNSWLQQKAQKHTPSPGPWNPAGAPSKVSERLFKGSKGWSVVTAVSSGRLQQGQRPTPQAFEPLTEPPPHPPHPAARMRASHTHMIREGLKVWSVVTAVSSVWLAAGHRPTPQAP